MRGGDYDYNQPKITMSEPCITIEETPVTMLCTWLKARGVAWKFEGDKLTLRKPGKEQVFDMSAANAKDFFTLVNEFVTS